MTRTLNIWWAAWALLIGTLFAAVPQLASAQEAKRVAVLDFKGPSAAAVQTQITSALKQEDSVELVSAREVKATSDRLGSSLGSASGYREVGEALELSAFIQGTVVKKGHRLQVTVTVRNAATGEVVHEETWTRRTNAVKTIKPQVWSALGPAIEDTSAPTPKAKPKPVAKPATKPKPAPPPEEDDDEDGARASDDGREEEEEQERAARKKKTKKASVPGDQSVAHPALVAWIGPRIMWRTLEYEGSPSSTNFQTYSSTDEGTPSFNLALGAQWYPGAHSRNDWLSDLGLDAELDYTMGLKAKVSDTNKEVKVSAYEIGFGAIYRFPFESFEPRLRLGFVRHVFDVDLNTMPGLAYNSLRIGAGTAINIVDWLSFDVNFAYLAVLSSGELEDDNFGEDVSTKAWEAGGAAIVRFAEVWGARLAIDYRRYGYDFGLSDNPGTVLPKSGTDGYLRLTLAAVYTLPGQKK